MKVLASIPARSLVDLRAGTLRRGDLQAYEGLLEQLQGARVALVTGGEHKQAAAVGLATAATTAGQAVALLEGDLARPALARALGLVPEPGLHEYLRWEAGAPKILQPVVLAGPGSGGATEPLVCIAAGRATSAGPTLFASEGFSHAIAKLRNAYDLVVIDGPPLERDPAQLHGLATHADAVLACVERSETGWRSSRRLKREMRRLTSATVGFVAVD